MRQIPLRLWAFSLLSGALQVLPFPIAGPTPLWRTAFCWIALLPLLYALLSVDRAGVPISPRQATLLGYTSGFVWYLGNCYWIFQTMYLYGSLAKPIATGILILFCLYLGLYHALFGCLLGLIRHRFRRQKALFFVPFLWVAIELARARITGLPWDLLGLAQVDNPVLTRLAPLTGAYGVSFVIASINALWLVRLRIRDRRYTRPILTLAGVICIITYVLALQRLSRGTDFRATATATLLQQNLEVGAAATDPEPSAAQLLDSFSRLSLDPPRLSCNGIPELPSTQCIRFFDEQPVAPTGSPIPLPTNLIVWPESPAPFQESSPDFRAALSALARQANAPIIVGNIGIDRTRDNPRGYLLFNSASFITPQGEFAGRYDKMHLVPFGEYVPFHQLFSFAKSLLNEVGTFDPGTTRATFTAAGHTYGVFICYESIFGDEVRHFVQQGAEVLVNISNDGWYGDTSAPWQHLNMVRMRAIENNRWILRSTNTGVTSAIDPAGHVTSAAPRHIRTALRVSFGYEHGLTFYAAHGDLFAYFCALVTAIALAYSFYRRLLPL